MADAGPSSMDFEQHQFASISSTSINNDDFNRRPDFVDVKKLKVKFGCKICEDVLLQPHQTVCGSRVCKKCIEDKFGDKTSIPCPLPHDDLDEEELMEEECQPSGLNRSHIIPDPAVQRQLLKEKCHCPNMPYGCCDKVQWKRLKEHIDTCGYVPSRCGNSGCPEMFAAQSLSHHMQECGYASVECRYCKKNFRRRDLEEHYNECDLAESLCNVCNKKFGRRKQLVVHQRMNPNCMTEAGKCLYYEHCGFETKNIKALKQHMKEAEREHLECLTVKTFEMDQFSQKFKDSASGDVQKIVNKKVKPLEKVTAEIAMNVKKMTDKMNASETNADHLVNAMRTVSHSNQQIETLTNKVGVIERQIKDSGLDRVTVIESHSQNIRRHNEAITDMEKRLRHVELCSYDGSLIWKINEYKRRKGDAIRGRQMSIYSHPFYSSRFGYKMCCRAYLNGDGLGRGKCLSLFFVVMRGEFDELLEWPFKQRVTFSLLCPTNGTLSKHETFMPDPDSTSFRRPQTDMNIASGCPQFALHTEVESSAFLINDSIYVRIKVEAGGDIVQ